MSRSVAIGKQLLRKCGRAVQTACDNELIGDEDETPILIQQADAINNEIDQVKTPMQYENISNAVRGGQVNLYDGFRVAVQKQVNMQSVVTHFYWMGSKVNGPIYQYRVILVNDEWMINAGTDLEFNNQIELKYAINKNLSTKCNINTIEHPGQPPMNSIGCEVELTDNCSASQAVCSVGGHEGNTCALSYMQAINPYLSLGGSGKYFFNTKIFSTSFGGVFDYNNNVVVAQYDHNSSVSTSFFPLVCVSRLQLCNPCVMYLLFTSIYTIVYAVINLRYIKGTYIVREGAFLCS